MIGVFHEEKGGRHMKLFKQLRLIGRMMLLSAIAMLCLTDVEVDAASNKETSLVNLAKGRTTVTDNQGRELTNPGLLTDEDKYYLEYSKEGNKVKDSKVESLDGYGKVVKGWEAYVEQGAQVENDAEYIQLDLGATYPIEVINLKRRMYDGVSNTEMKGGHSNNALKYEDTIIVIGNEKDLSDGYVVYYNDDDGSVKLPQGVKKPENIATGGMKESMAGTYFYMDNTKENGTGYTELGTTKEARYIRIYSDHPDQDEKLMFMELGVYGYKAQENVQKTSGKRQVINNKNPLMIAAAYSDDQFYLGQEEKVGLQGYNTIAGRWNTVAEDLRDNTVLMMHSNNLRSFSPDYIGQAYIHNYYERCLQEAYEAGAPTMLMLVNASSYPGGTRWCITRDVDYHWVDLMFRMYPNLEGVFSTENFWSGRIDGVAESVATYLEMADRYGGYVVYSEEGTGIFNTLANNSKLRKAVEEHGQSLFFTYKNTAGGSDCLLTQSHIMGSWLAGYTGGWGMLSDSWAWGNNGNGPIYKPRGNYEGWQSLCAEPEAIYGEQMINTWLAGGVVYTFEFPEVVYGAIDAKSPAYTHVVEPVFRHICENPAPSRADVLNNTKSIIYDRVPSDLYGQTVGADNVLGLFQTSRYGAMPSVPTWGDKEQVTQKLKETAKTEGAAAPIVLSNSDMLLRYGAKDYFNSLYPLTYLGNAFAKEYDGAWYIYNSTVNKPVNQEATLPLEAAESTARFSATVEPHTFLWMQESGEDSISVSLNNYRINAEEIIFKNKYNWKWDGSSATGQGVSNAKLTVYRYMAYYNAVNAQKDVENLDVVTKNEQPRIDQLSPNDNELRTTTFKITKVSKEPKVELVKGQAPDTDGAVQYKEPKVDYDEQTKTATIIIQTNGWVELKISDLNYEVDETAGDIENTPEPEYGEKTNLAKGKKVSGSHNDNNYSRITDGVKTCGDRDYANFGDVNAPVWLEIDLQGVHRVEEVNLWRYFRRDPNPRAYKDTVILLSPEKGFPEDKTLVIWNSNATEDSKKWENDDIAKDIPKGQDELYLETENGKSFPVYGKNVAFLNGSKVGVPTEEGENYFDARYVRVYMNGNQQYRDETMKDEVNQGKSNHVIEVEVNGQPNLKDQVNYTNLATNSYVSVSGDTSSDRPASIVVDKVKNDPNKYADPGGSTGGAHWIQLDMGVEHDVEKLVLYRYWQDGRKYYNTVVMLSPDENFSPESTLVLWNGNGNAGGRGGKPVTSWPGNGNGTTGTHTLPEGSEATYVETQNGKTFNVNDGTVSWLKNDNSKPLPKDDNQRFKARYARVYMNGNSTNGGITNHVVEIEVFGEAGKFILKDEQAPEKVTGIDVTKKRTTTAVVNFLPSMDNMGLKEYELSLRKAGGAEEKKVKLNQTSYELTGLTPGTEYEVTLKAIDNYNNESEISAPVTFTTHNESDFVVGANVPSGRYDGAQQVTLSNGLNEGEIYYTLDGTRPFDENGNPTQTAVKYEPNAVIGVGQSCILQAALKVDGYVWPISAYFYQIGPEAMMDFDAPMAPASLTVTSLSATGASVSWSSSSPDVKAFYIYVDGEKKGEVSIDQARMEATIVDLAPLTSYQIWVTAVDGAGNESIRSQTIELVTRFQ